jgi:hypothetical protein
MEVAFIKRHEDFDILTNLKSLGEIVPYDIVLMQSSAWDKQIGRIGSSHDGVLA